MERNGGVAPGSTVTAWLDEMSRHLRSLGIRQLIASGEEGYRCGCGQPSRLMKSLATWLTLRILLLILLLSSRGVCVHTIPSLSFRPM